MIANCSKCGAPLVKKVKGKRACNVCLAAYQRAYYAERRDALRAYNRERHHVRRKNQEWVEQERKRGREYWAKLRHDAIIAYGGYKCACCGEQEPKFLTLDHVFNNGASHRKQIRNRGAGIFKWLRDNGYPAGFQVLCMNCNHGKALNNGICPHKAKSSLENRVKTGEAQTG